MPACHAAPDDLAQHALRPDGFNSRNTEGFDVVRPLLQRFEPPHRVDGRTGLVALLGAALAVRAPRAAGCALLTAAGHGALRLLHDDPQTLDDDRLRLRVVGDAVLALTGAGL